MNNLTYDEIYRLNTETLSIEECEILNKKYQCELPCNDGSVTDILLPLSECLRIFIKEMRLNA